MAAAAVVATPAPLGTLGRLAALTDPFAALDEAVGAQLLERHGSPPGVQVSFAHPLVAAAAYEALDTAPRVGLHRRAAELAEDDGTRIRHEVAASAGKDEALSARVAEHARRQQARGALATAGLAFVKAAQLAPDLGSHDDRLLDAAESFLMAGEVASAVGLLGEHPDLAPGRRSDYVRGWEAFATGRLDDARQLLTRALNNGRDELAGSAARLLAYLELLTGQGQQSASWAERAVQFSPKGWHRNTASAIRAMCLFIAGRAADAYAALDWLPEAGELTADALDAAAVRANLRHFEGDAERARGEYHAILAASRSGGDFLLAASVQGNLAEIEYRTGHWDDAVDFGERAVSVANDLDQSFVLACVHGVASPVYSRRGQWERAQQHVQAAQEAAGMLRDSASVAYAGTAAAVLAHSRRDYPGVLSAVDPLVGAPSRDGVDEPGIFMWRELQVEALVRLARLDEAEAALAPHEERAAARARRSVMGCAARTRGLLEAARGNPQGAAESFDVAVAHLQATGMVFEEALTHLAAGATLRRRGARRTAAQHLNAATGIFDSLGAAPFVEQSALELRGCGLTPARRSTPSPPRLTPQETSVARLVASGKTNRDVAADLVLSVKTVEYHLSNVFTKLGIRSRTQLVQYLTSAADNPLAQVR